ncbi:MAG: right-handed parallel beta-helix repeat-containing protein [Cyclobacteriaceae bacterium]
MRCFHLIFFTLAIAFAPESHAQKFVHPGINQTADDLEYMRQQVLKGEQPWKDAFERLKAATDLNFAIKPFAHVMRGPYGRPNIGGDDLSKGANMAYNCALMWYITQDKAYSQKAIGIINAWSPVLWDFDYNDAKLLAGWTGHLFCNAAEILRYTNSGWQQKDTDSFTNMLMTVYYPLMRFYYPQANGNWDGAIIHSILAIAIFTDNREMFNNGVNHFLYGEVNGGIFKYIYPSGQCQETMRDQAHVQLGLGEFAGAAQIAYTQGVDLFSIGNNRIALGYEYTAGFLIGKMPHSYGVISERAKKFRDDYEYVYRHYTAMGLNLPNTRVAADSVRSIATRSVLTAFRAPGVIVSKSSGIPEPGQIGFPAGARDKAGYNAPKDPIMVEPGQSLQEALDATAGTGRWVIAKKGLHTLPSTLRMPSSVTLAGEGTGTKLFLDPASGVRDAIVNATDDLHSVIIRDLVVEGSARPEPPSDPNSARSYRSSENRGGIMFLSPKEGQMKNLHLTNVTVQNCTYNGVFISGARGVSILNCDLTENGSSVVPGPKLQHNLLLTHCTDINILDSRLDTSPYGSGVALSQSMDAEISNCEIARNGYYGILIQECRDILIKGNLIEANDRSGIMAEFLYRGSENINVANNILQYNNGHGVETYAVRKSKLLDNIYAGNREAPEKISDEKFILMK